MAQLKNTAITGSLTISGSVISLPQFTSSQTGSFVTSGNMWYNTTINKLSYVANGVVVNL